jgi:hypothetical protein
MVSFVLKIARSNFSEILNVGQMVFILVVISVFGCLVFFSYSLAFTCLVDRTLSCFSSFSCLIFTELAQKGARVSFILHWDAQIRINCSSSVVIQKSFLFTSLSSLFSHSSFLSLDLVVSLLINECGTACNKERNFIWGGPK